MHKWMHNRTIFSVKYTETGALGQGMWGVWLGGFPHPDYAMK